MGCGKKLLKVTLTTINIIFFLAGAAILAVGLWVRFEKDLAHFANKETGLEQVGSVLRAGAYVLIGFGAFTFAVGFCGFFGTLKDSKFLLGVYIALVSVIFAAEIGGGAYAYSKRTSLMDEVGLTGKMYLKESYAGNSAADGVWDAVMITIQCCGVDGPEDFFQSPYHKNSIAKNDEYKYPDSCCVQAKPWEGKLNVINWAECHSSRKDPLVHSHANPGCKTKILDLFTKYSSYLLATAGAIAGFELLVIMAAIAYCCSIKKDAIKPQ